MSTVCSYVFLGHLDMVKFLLEAGADHEHKTDEMHTALMEACMDGHVDVARLLLDSGAQVNMPIDSFESPLTLAACGGHVELANLLIERGANLEEGNDEGYTPLMGASREGHEESWRNTSGGEGLEIERGLHFNVMALLTMPLRSGIEHRRFEAARLAAAQATVGTALDARRAWIDAVHARQSAEYYTQVVESAAARNPRLSPLPNHRSPPPCRGPNQPLARRCFS